MSGAVRFAAWVVIVPTGPLTVIYFPPWACVFWFFRFLTRSSLLYTCCICFQSTFDERLSEKKTNQTIVRILTCVCRSRDYECCIGLSAYIYIAGIFYQSIKIMISICILHNLQNKLTCFRDNLNTQRFIKCFIAINCYVCICWNGYE